MRSRPVRPVSRAPTAQDAEVAETLKATAANVRHAVEEAWPAAVVGVLAVAFVILL